MKGLSNAANAAIAAQCAALAGPYNALASHLATALAANKAHGDKLKTERATLWDQFKSAIDVAQENGHDPSAMRAGLEIACVSAGIAPGSFRGYVSTVENLAVDLAEGNLTREEVASIAVADARARYFDDAKKELVAARQALATATEGWTAENIRKLATLAADISAPIVKEKKAKKAA
jgi:uncharacterized protein (UPF0335 family)